MCNTEIGTYCNNHANWINELAQEPYCLKIKRDEGYVMFSYDQIRSDFNNKIVREARGIIFKEGYWKNPVCWAFNKFGNYGESYAPDIDWCTAFVTEKIDGSLIKVWWNGNYWRISTNGTIDAFKAEINNVKMHNFGDYFIEAIKKYYDRFDDFFRDLDKNLTYMFELVGPYNRVVVPYEEPDVYFLGARDKFTGEERFCIPVEAKVLGVFALKRPRIYQLTSLENCIKVTEEFGWDQEGFVVCDANFNRVKVKSPAYVMAHFMRNNNVITRKHLLRVIIEGEIEEFLCYASDYKEELFKTQKLMKAYHKVGNQLAKACRETTAILHRGDYARLVKALPTIFQGLLFLNYDRDITAEEYTANWNENKWEEYLEALEKLNKEILEV